MLRESEGVAGEGKEGRELKWDGRTVRRRLYCQRVNCTTGCGRDDRMKRKPVLTKSWRGQIKSVGE